MQAEGFNGGARHLSEQRQKFSIFLSITIVTSNAAVTHVISVCSPNGSTHPPIVQPRFVRLGTSLGPFNFVSLKKSVDLGESAS